jgi:acyl-CoA synthetase (AMP-forming)/AMP-acid ligase II
VSRVSADAFNLSAETLLEQAGLLDDPTPGKADTEAAIGVDDVLGELALRLQELLGEGRLKEIVRRGGLMIDAIELSDLLSEHPEVAEVIVVGTPDARLGERAVAVVVPRGEERPRLDDLCAFLAERGLSQEVLPEELLFADSIPRTEFGEFNRGEVRAWVLMRLEEVRAY